MSKLVLLVKYNFILQHRSYQLIKTSCYNLLLYLLALIFMIEQELPLHSKLILCLFCALIAILNTPYHLIKSDLVDGWLDNLMLNLSSQSIIMALFITISLMHIMALSLALPVIALFYDIDFWSLIWLWGVGGGLIMQITSFVILINITVTYFRRNNTMLLCLILPLIFPSLILAGVALSTFNIDFLMILLGVDLIIIPLTLVCGGYLLKNVYD